MQRTTLSTYPNLITVKHINGTVYKVTQITQPHPKITVMSYEEVQMHEKCEAAASILGQKTRRNMFGRRMKTLKEKEMDAGVSAPSKGEESHDSKKDSKDGLWRKMKKGVKKILPPRVTKTPPLAADLTPGFHCASRSSPPCVPNPALSTLPAPTVSLHALGTPLTNINTAHPTIPMTSTSSFSSGFTASTCTSSTSSSSPKLPTIHIPLAPENMENSPTTSAMHDTFADFSGVYCTDTPPQIAPLCPISAFLEKLLSPPLTLPPTTSTPLPSTPPTLQYTSAPAPAFLSSDTESSSPGMTWPTCHLDTPCPTHRQSVWSFDLVAPDSAFVAMGNKGDGARRKSGWRGTVWVEGDGD